jgi:hypothetical protein
MCTPVILVIWSQRTIRGQLSVLLGELELLATRPRMELRHGRGHWGSGQPLSVDRHLLQRREAIMKKRVKRTKAKSASKRARTKSKTKKTTKAKTPAKTKKTLLPKVQRVAKKAALAAGMAAIGTALSELQPEQKSAQQNASDHGKSKRGNSSED